MSFTRPMSWSEPQNHINDCYFCMTRTRGFTSKNKNKIVYPNIPSVRRPIPRRNDVFPLVPPNSNEIVNAEIALGSLTQSSYCSTCTTLPLSTTPSKRPHLLKQSNLNLLETLKIEESTS